MTFATDILLAIVTFVLGRRLFRLSPRGRPRAVRLWGWTFVWLTIAAAVGGTYHGAAALVSPLVSEILWRVTIYSIGLADASILAALVFARAPVRWHRALLGLLALKLALFVAWTIADDTFATVIYDYAPSLVVVLVVALSGFVRTRSPGSGWIAAGIVVSFAAAAVQLGGRGFHRHFNENDLYHVVQMVAMILLYRGGRELRDRAEAPA